MKATRRETIAWGLGMGTDKCACVGKASSGRGWNGREIDHGEVGSVLRRGHGLWIWAVDMGGYWGIGWMSVHEAR